MGSTRPVAVIGSVLSPQRAHVPYSPFDWLTLFGMLWVSVSLAIAVKLYYQRQHIRQIVATATPLTVPAMRAVFTEVRRAFQLDDRQIALCEYPASVPMVCGLWRPVVILPFSARTWDESRLRSVLLHELAHIRRLDSVSQAISVIAIVIHWYNPLVWLAIRRLHIERERACDDAVLAAGRSPRAYASDLLDLAQEFQTLHGAALVGIPFARPSQVHGRVISIIDRTRNRQLPSSRETVTTWCLGFALVCPLMTFVPSVVRHQGRVVSLMPVPSSPFTSSSQEIAHMNKMTRTMAAAAAVPLFGVSPAFQHRQQPNIAPPSGTPHAIQTRADTTDVTVLLFPNIVQTTTAEIIKKGILDASSVAILANLPADSVHSEVDYTDSGLTSVLITITSGAPAIIVNGTPVTDRTVTLDLSQLASVDFFKASPNGTWGSNGTIAFNYKH